jgi:hypothetical protein
MMLERRTLTESPTSSWLVAFSAAALALACNSTKSSNEPSAAESAVVVAPSAKAKVAPAPSAAPAKPEERPFRFPAVPRLVAIGDLHGDLESARAALRLAGAIDDGEHWSGGKLVVVQTGDQLDRGDQEREILDMLDRLTDEAAKAGGALHVLNGNHETMNVLGDFRYVTPRGFTSFEGVNPQSPLAARYPSDFGARAAAFLPGGAYATLLSKRDVVAVVGDTAFVHGGIRPPIVDYGIGRLNAETSAFMRGETKQPPRLIVDQEGPVWTRVYGEPTLSEMACNVLARALEKLQVKRMVVGHTVQEEGITSACDDRVYRIDVGLSHYYGGEVVQVLEITRDDAGKEQVRILSAPKAAK